MPAIVRPGQVQITWPERHNAGRIDVADRVVAALDACNVGDLGDARPLVELAQVVRQVVILVYVIAIAFEIAVVGRAGGTNGKSEFSSIATGAMK